MEMKVKLFAALRDGAGADQIQIEWKQGITCRDVLTEIKNRFAFMAALFEKSFIAVNGGYADFSRNLMPEDEIAILPPVSGG